jgi:adenosine kinase
VRILVTGSIATDHLMSFPGRFADSLVADKLSSVSLSFLADELQIRRGGVAPNICFGLGSLGLNPVLVGAAGADFEDYRAWLERHGVDTGAVHISEVHHTARFVCTTDLDHNQIATFYAGAMSEARDIELHPVAVERGGADLVVIGANDPEAMLRHTDECRYRNLPFAADPSQQLARMEGPEIRRLVEGAAFLLTNEYEAALTEHKTGWTSTQVLDRVGVRVTTLGPAGVRVERAGHEPIEVKVPPEHARLDPTGVGDAFRAGFLAGWAWGIGLQRAAEVGSMLATLVIETVGTQEYDLQLGRFFSRFRAYYGEESAAAVAAHLPPVVTRT